MRHSIEPRIDHASALFYIRKGSKWQDMVYKLKYWGGWRNGYDLGRWLGVELKASKLYNTVDLIVPVPLHPMRQVARGYNQSEFIARGIARSIGIEIDNSTLFRRHHISSQVNSSRMDRWLNMECMFGVKRSHKFEGRHILIVDDVCTTGATTLACAEAIFNSVKDVKISIATLATIDKNFGINLMMDDKL